MNFASTPKQCGSSSKRVLILQAEQTRAVAHPSSACCTFVDTCESASAGGARFLCRDFEQKKKRRTRPIDLAGELASHSCAVSQLLVGRRHRFGICVPETQNPRCCAITRRPRDAIASSSVLLNLVLTTMRFTAIVLSATLLAKADAPRAGASLWAGAILVSAGVVAFATSPPAMKERRPSRKAHVSDPIPEEEA